MKQHAGFCLIVVSALMTPAFAADVPNYKLGDKVPDFTLDAIDGGKVTLSSVAEKGPVVLVVLRGYPGYQCPLCTRQVADLVGNAEAIRATGASVIMVYPGPADALKAHADEFLKGSTLPDGFRLVIDPDYSFTNGYKLRWDAPKETAYPSTFVLDKTLGVRFAKVSRTHGGRANSKEILAALTP